MSIWGSAKSTFKNYMSPSKFIPNILSGVDELQRPVQELLKSNPIKAPWKTMGNVGNFAVGSALPAYFVYDAMRPDRPDLDLTGPFEHGARRSSDMMAALTGTTPVIWGGKSLLGNILGGIAAYMAMNTAATYGGRALDKMTGNYPSLMEMEQRFHDRIAPLIDKKIQSGMHPEEANKAALMDVLSANPGYAELFKDR